MQDKKYSPREAAMAVLKKAEQLYKNSALAKGQDLKKDSMMTSAPATPPPSSPGPQHLLDNADPKAAASIANVFKADPAGNPDAKADAALGEKVEQDVQQHEAQNAAPEHAMPMKGHIKLAKFMGRMEHKKGMKAAPEMAKAESDFDKLKNKIKAKEGYSEEAAAATAAKIGREKLGEAEMARRSAAGRKKSK